MNIEITLLIVLHSQEPGGMRMPGEPAITYNFLTCMLSGLTLLSRLQFHSHASQSHPARGTACMYGWDAQSTSAFARCAGLAVASHFSTRTSPWDIRISSQCSLHAAFDGLLCWHGQRSRNARAFRPCQLRSARRLPPISW